MENHETVYRIGSNTLRKPIEGYLDSVPSLTFNTIKKTKPIRHKS